MALDFEKGLLCRACDALIVPVSSRSPTGRTTWRIPRAMPWRGARPSTKYARPPTTSRTAPLNDCPLRLPPSQLPRSGSVLRSTSYLASYLATYLASDPASSLASYSAFYPASYAVPNWISTPYVGRRNPASFGPRKASCSKEKHTYIHLVRLFAFQTICSSYFNLALS